MSGVMRKMSGQLVSRGGLLGGVGVLAALLLVVPASAQQPPVKLAIVAEITGGGAAVGAMWRDGINLAVEDINKKGGVLGRRLETFVMDTQTDPPTSVAVMRRAFNEQPFVIMGTVYSSSTVANMDIVRQAGIPQISGSESVLLIQKGNPNIFLTAFTQQIGMAKQVRWLVEDLKADKIALVYVNNAFGRGGREMFLKFVKDRGKTVVADISTEPQQADFTAELTRVRASGATHLMVYNHEEENARLMIQPPDDPAPQAGDERGGRGRDHPLRPDGHRSGRGGDERREVPRGDDRGLDRPQHGGREPAVPAEVREGAGSQCLQGLHRHPHAEGGGPAGGGLRPGEAARLPPQQSVHRGRGTRIAHGHVRG
ncbi:MAG: amino acid ABC transporter substrate-binding protein [candidate division NC10 bacterium]|nr:amino acid ABC transporter substrate-binding protein [candidate division NC10 bacterium]